ncbi:hypothetical protein [Nitrosomonas ureae]
MFELQRRAEVILELGAPWSGGQHHRVVEHDLHRRGDCAAIAGELPIRGEDVARFPPFVHARHMN